MDAGTIRQAFQLVLGLTYIGLGVFMFFTKVIPMSPWREIVSLLFVSYGAWRAYRSFLKK